jgi:AcrR family transcriptional regulator
MSRPVTIRTDAILDAARAVFLARGVTGRTAEVAARAGVSEGSVFKRFPTKAILFREAMRAGIGDAPWPDGLMDRAGGDDVRETVVDIGREALAWHRRVRPLLALASSGGDGAEVTGSAAAEAERAVGCLATFLGTEMRLGRLAAQDPMLAARVLLGAIERFAATDRGSGGLAEEREDAFLHGVIGLMLDGLAPRGGPCGRKGSARADG